MRLQQSVYEQIVFLHFRPSRSDAIFRISDLFKAACYVKNLKIVLETAAVVFKKDGITDGENATALNYGDVLLQEGKVTGEEYIRLKKEADAILENRREAAWK